MRSFASGLRNHPVRTGVRVSEQVLSSVVRILIILISFANRLGRRGSAICEFLARATRMRCSYAGRAHWEIFTRLCKRWEPKGI